MIANVVAGLFMRDGGVARKRYASPSVASTDPAHVYVRPHTYVPHFRPGTTLAISGHDASLDPDKVCDPPPAKLAAAREPGRNLRRGRNKKNERERRSANRGDGERHSKIPFEPLPQPPVEFPARSDL